MKSRAVLIVLVDDDEDDIAAAEDASYGLSVVKPYDCEGLERKIVLENRRVVLINADSSPMEAVGLAIFAAGRTPAIYVGVLSASNALPRGLTDAPSFVNGTTVVFSNGERCGLLVARPRRDCGICGGTGSIIAGPDEDVCPSCEEQMMHKTSKDWMNFFQFVSRCREWQY